MNATMTKIRRMLGHVGLTAGLCALPASGQVTYEWTGLGDGQSFGAVANWTPNGVPGLLDEAKFDGASSRVISFASSPANATASIENDTVRFNLGAQTYTAGQLIVGDRMTDVGSLTVNGGRLVTTSGLARIGRLSPSTGSLFITGGATMDNQRDLVVGDEGSGFLQIDTGCSVTSLIAFIADADTATGDAIVRGTWNIQNSALIGNSGMGALTVESGGDVAVGLDTKVGDDPLSSGSLTIDGPGSTLTSTAATTIGNFGEGSLTVSNGGRLTTAQLKIADDAPAAVIVDAGTIIDSVATGVGNRAVGTMTLNRGGVVQSPLVTVGALGTLGGSGTIQGMVLSAGRVSPGTGPGTLAVTGNYTQTIGILDIQIGGPNAGTQYDQLTVGGIANLGGTLNVVLTNGYNPVAGEYVILQGGTVSGAFGIANLPAGFTISYEAGRVVVSIGDPCPADFNGDGVVNTQDFLSYLNAWAVGDLRADTDGNGTVNTIDFLSYLNLWVAGC
jgi:T5SS/PEP-CTERM-associated repeat protein